MANPFDVNVPNILQAILAFDQGREASQKISQQNAIKQAGQLYANGDISGALSAASQAGDLQSMLGIAGLRNQDRSFGLQQQQFGEVARHNKASEGLQGQQISQTGTYQQGQLGIQRDTLAETKRQHDIEAAKPIPVPSGSTLTSREGTPLYTNSGGLSDAANEITARQIINGDLSGLQNIGRGAQGDQKLTQIRNKAADILVNEYGMNPQEAAAHLGQKFTAFKAGQTGANAGARTGATREANLDIIIKAADAAIPAALEASDRVSRTGFVPLNRIIQGGQVITSDPDLKAFGMANLQLAEHWARAMNPTGVMRESDRDMALKFLSTADTKETYKRAVEQLRTQIQRERDAIASSGYAPQSHPATTPQAAPSIQAQSKDEVIQQARDAIAKGADRNAVIQRLQKNGIDASGL